jgi:Mg-chelatase subunit ChlD
MLLRKWFVAALLTGAAALAVAGPAAAAEARKARPRVEVVFCLDTTGSMGGLIEGAKQKIWSLCNQIAGGQPTPELKVGLVAYRDRGDAYVTKMTDLTGDLDAVHGELMGFQAGGGGDTPESVNEALRVALHDIHWSTDSKTLRIIYLVGDAPPHMDYDNDVPYTATCRQACERGIIINTIQCGNLAETTPVWQEIARKAEGKFVQIAQNGGVQTVSTPYDARLAEINAAMAKTNVVYGDAGTRAAATARQESVCLGLPAGAPTGGGTGSLMFAPVMTSPTMTWAVPAAPCMAGCAPMPCAAPAPPAGLVAAAADRAGYCAKTGKVAALDLLDAIKEGKVKLEDVKTAELPEEMQKLNLAQRKTYLAKVETDRAKLRTEALELDRQRTEYINRELNSRNGAGGFDAEVMQMLRDQAKKHNIAY